MNIDYQKLRLFGVYQQDKDDNLMLRVKIPAGFISSVQAETICVLSEQLSNGVLHLTCRGSIEFHWLRHQNLEEIFARLADVGLTTQGACGGAVRGISCSTTFAPGFTVVQRVAQKLNRHFAGNPDFEGLPKKFKVGIDAGYHDARHLIQDLGLVLVGTKEGRSTFDVWCAGGLGREPQASFLLEKAFPEERLIHLIESVVQVYKENTPPPKRLKFLLNTVGKEAFLKLLQEEVERRPQPVLKELQGDVNPKSPDGTFVEIPVFAGEITTARMRILTAVARDSSNGHLAVTADQNLAILATSNQKIEALHIALEEQGIKRDDPTLLPRLRVCPGNHECRMGLSPTREIAKMISTAATSTAREKRWAISGCRNSCSQPQLAEIGIVTKKLIATEEGTKEPRFDLFRRDGEGLGRCIAEEIDAEALYEAIRKIN